MVAPMVRWGGRRGVLIPVLLALLAGIGAGLVLLRILSGPADPEAPSIDPQAGLRVQSVVAQLLLREAGLSARQDPLILTGAEVTAFLIQHVQVRDAPVWPVRVLIEPDGVEVGGATTLGQLITSALGSAAGRPRARLGGRVPRLDRRAGHDRGVIRGARGVPGPRGNDRASGGAADPSVVGRRWAPAGPGLADAAGRRPGGRRGGAGWSSIPGAPGRAEPLRARTPAQRFPRRA